MPSRSAIVLLWVLAAAFLVVGIGFVAAPATFAEMAAGESPDRASAVTDMRAVSGGVAVALGVFFGLCATRPTWVAPGLVMGALVLACLAASRLIGFVVDGGVTGTQVSLATSEALVMGLCLLALRGQSVER
jgi:hypothetical protein